MALHHGHLSGGFLFGLLAALCYAVAQSRVSAERAGLFCAINPAIAALLGVVVLDEQLGVSGFIGILLILGSLLMPHLLEKHVSEEE